MIETNLEAIIMSGGEGKRLRPYTNNIPKPLLNINGKPMIRHVVDHLYHYGVKNFHFTLHYLGSLIEEEMIRHKKDDQNFYFYYEKEPLGTFGGVGSIKNIKSERIILVNSDILTSINYEELHEYSCENNSDFTITTIPYEIEIPFATLDTIENKVLNILEKPIVEYKVNAGIYMFKKEILNLVPLDTKIDITDFISKLLNEDFSVHHFYTNKYWIDVGRMDDYQRANHYN
jgi:NDP-sugar pyrophosphorylase family protein